MAAKKVQAVQAKTRGEKAALLIIDVQNGLFQKSTPVYQAERLLENIRALGERARAAGAPVIYVQHTDPRWLAKGMDTWPIHPGVQPQPGDRVMDKTHPNSFEDTPLEGELDALGVGVVVVAGLVTHGCVKATCQGAKKLGFRAVLVSDGHSNFNKEPEPLIAETHAKLAAEGVELVSTAEVRF
jgi:nicotinamidase-related amidase